MARVVAVHGVGAQVRGEALLLKEWRPALIDGLRRADGPSLVESEVAMAFYGDLFRPHGRTLTVGDLPYGADDVDDGFERELLFAWWRRAAEIYPGVASPDADVMARAPRSVQAALRALSRSGFFSGLALRSLVSDLKQVRRYLMEPELREAARSRLATQIGPDTQVVVGHSLGSVVAYETLCHLTGHNVRALVTLGSPLGIPMIYDQLSPKPGAWPGSAPDAPTWSNIVDEGDVVALVEDLRPQFGEHVRGSVVHNGAHAHDATAYLTDRLTGIAVAGGLRA